MILDSWRRDAEKLISLLPTEAPVAKRAGYLVGDVSARGFEVDASVFDRSTIPPLPAESFLVVDRLALTQSRSSLGHMALRLPGVAFVAHSQEAPSVLTLPTRDPAKPSGNGSILLHELEHITEAEEGLAMMSVGQRERRAYQANIDLLAAVDGSDFGSYIDNWPADFRHTSASGEQPAYRSADIWFRDENCPRPPRGTLAYDIWKEDGTSRQVLQSIGRSAVFDKLTAGLDEDLVSRLADTLHN